MSPSPSAVPDLPRLDEVFEALRRGRHLSMDDGDLYFALRSHEPAFEALFARLGFTMVRHPRDFYYFLGDGEPGDQTTRLAVFMLILVEALADTGAAVEERIMAQPFALAELPHFQSERYQGLMREAGVASPDDLAKLLQAMERFGFTRSLGGDAFAFRTPAYRFLDLCLDLAEEAGKEEGAPASDGDDAGMEAPP